MWNLWKFHSIEEKPPKILEIDVSPNWISPRVRMYLKRNFIVSSKISHSNTKPHETNVKSLCNKYCLPFRNRNSILSNFPSSFAHFFALSPTINRLHSFVVVSFLINLWLWIRNYSICLNCSLTLTSHDRVKFCDKFSVPSWLSVTCHLQQQHLSQENSSVEQFSTWLSAEKASSISCEWCLNEQMGELLLGVINKNIQFLHPFIKQ